MENAQGMATFAVFAGLALLGMFVFVARYSYNDRSEVGKLRSEEREERRRQRHG